MWRKACHTIRLASDGGSASPYLILSCTLATQIVEIPGPDLLRKGAKRIYTYPGYATVGYPNRDSSFYDTRYNMPECETVLRGTLRYDVRPRVRTIHSYVRMALISVCVCV